MVNQEEKLEEKNSTEAENIVKAKEKNKTKKTKTTKKTNKQKNGKTKGGKSTKKEKVITNDITRVYAPKKNKASTVTEELAKVTNVMSKEQIKKPKKIVFMICFYVLLALAIVILCFIKFSRTEKVIVPEDIETAKTYIPKIEPIEVDKNLILGDDELKENVDIKSEKEVISGTTEVLKETTKETTKATVKVEVRETTKATVKETAKVEVRETTKAVTKETVKPKETISASIFNKAQNKKNEQTNNVNLPMLNRLLPKYDTELYSSATYYQYNASDISDAFTQLTAYYKSAEDKIWGDVNLDEKGINGKLYLNHTYMKKFIDNITDLDRSKYASLVDVQTTSEPVSFDFANAKDMGIYYEVPASDGKNKLNLMILKGSRVGFSQSFSLMTSLEILDLEWGTKHNPYFAIEDVVGVNPKAKEILTDTSFKIEETLSNTKFNRIRYDKKGYITDLFYFQ